MSTILVVDDDAASRLLVRAALELSGHEVIEAPHGRAALEIIGSEVLPDIVATDLAMPILDGEGLIESLRAEPRTAAIPIVIVSGDFEAALAVHKSRHVAAIVHKPFDHGLLALCISAIANSADPAAQTLVGDY